VHPQILEASVVWIGHGQLSVPIRTQLSAVIFEKSMRRKNVKSASKSDKDKSKKSSDVNAQAIGTSGAETDTKKAEQTEDDDDDGNDISGQKSRQAVINLIGVDAQRIANFAWFQFFYPSSIVKLTVGCWFLVTLLGWIPLCAGFLLWFIILPTGMHFAKRYGVATDRLMKLRDQKLAIINESLQGIRQIKFSALESQWEKRILASREKELKACWGVFVNQVALIGCWITSPIALAAASLSVHAWLNGQLTPSVAFVAVSVFKALETAFGIIPQLTTEAFDCWVSIKRIEEYLEGPELVRVTKNNPDVAFERANIAWPVDEETNESERFVLRNVDLVFPKGKLSVISGKTGTGKSLMLAAIIGEADILSGSIYVPDPPKIEERYDHEANRHNWILSNSTAFVGQMPWLENASLRDNILFGLPFDEGRYWDTIEACALTKDLEILADGDKTELGANGINISGGQKWRIMLARAVYSRAGILVFDDIFSAVDAHVGRHLLEKCLVGDLCKDRTRILVTHHVSLVASAANFVVELADGVVAAAGLTSELEKEGILAKIKRHEQSQREIMEEEAVTAVNSEDVSEVDGQEESSTGGAPLKKVLSKKPQKFVEDETREKGAIKKEVYVLYLGESGGWVWWTLLAAIFIMHQAFVIGKLLGSFAFTNTNSTTF
jgi:ABC-type multidrug transport system fused ATPase/permease subunit